MDIQEGKKYGRLTAIRVHTPGKKGQAATWLCRCDCGKEKVANKYSLRNGHTASCGCLKSEIVIARSTSHGQCYSPAYGSWTRMKCRCQNPNFPRFKDYGGRGIKVCDRWQKFENFLADMGERPKGTTLDRIENDGDYEPGNCRWATPLEQGNNQRTNRLINFGGVTKTVAQWCQHYGIGGCGSPGQAKVRNRISDCDREGQKITPRVFDLKRRYQSDPERVKGVTFERDCQKWRAAHVADGKRVYIGKFADKTDAIEALNKWRAEN